ncbi:DUF3306 domain-containing protein [Oceanibium sediminis]|uniref:DUF3306 domain-containing protein n=1 Tax=Oceanibium sediminis TaxID=2026339 RepID=UPI000DD4847D|nr:DUF3306 domain-containing protein [Oceanibium sediminis]
MSGAGDDFWSRRKAAVEAEERALRDAAADRDAALSRDALAKLPDEEVLKRLDLPEPESLKEGDDFSVFMSGLVPETLRRRALRHLWRTNPALGALDGLVDYGADYTDSATVVADLQTAYQVGKGMLRHVEAMAARDEDQEGVAEGGEDAPRPGTAAAPEAETPAEAGAASLPDPAQDDAAVGAEQALPEPPDCAPENDAAPGEPPLRPVRRRLKFRYLD